MLQKKFIIKQIWPSLSNAWLKTLSLSIFEVQNLDFRVGIWKKWTCINLGIEDDPNSLRDPETWPDVEPVIMDEDDNSKIFFTCSFDLEPGVIFFTVFKRFDS